MTSKLKICLACFVGIALCFGLIFGILNISLLKVDIITKITYIEETSKAINYSITNAAPKDVFQNLSEDMLHTRRMLNSVNDDLKQILLVNSEIGSQISANISECHRNIASIANELHNVSERLQIAMLELNINKDFANFRINALQQEEKNLTDTIDFLTKVFNAQALFLNDTEKKVQTANNNCESNHAQKARKVKKVTGTNIKDIAQWFFITMGFLILAVVYWCTRS